MENLKEIFKAYPINVSGFALYSGINRSLLSQYVSGKKVPSEKQVLKIVESLNKLGNQLIDVSSYEKKRRNSKSRFKKIP